MEYLPVFIFGWPSAIMGVVLLVTGLVARKPKLSIAGAVVATGFCVYIVMHPSPVRWFAAAAIIGNYLSAFALSRKAVPQAAVLLLPFVIVMLSVGNAVFASWRTGA